MVAEVDLLLAVARCCLPLRLSRVRRVSRARGRSTSLSLTRVLRGGWQAREKRNMAQIAVAQRDIKSSTEILRVASSSRHPNASPARTT